MCYLLICEALCGYCLWKCSFQIWKEALHSSSLQPFLGGMSFLLVLASWMVFIHSCYSSYFVPPLMSCKDCEKKIQSSMDMQGTGVS